MSDTIELTQSQPALAASARLLAYFELTKPRIGSLVLVATGVGFYLALPAGGWNLAAATTLIHAIVATALVAGGANAMNQVLEAELDALMVRTANRPIPSGRLRSSEAFWFALLSASIGTAYMSFFVNLLAAALLAFTFVSYVYVYTPLKTRTSLCVIIGAVPGALPPVIGWAAGAGSTSMGAWLLFGIIFFWQLPHFAAIAWQYRDDYVRGGFPMISVIDPDGHRTRLHIVTHTVGLIAMSIFPALGGIAGPWYGLSAMVLGVLFLTSGIVFVGRLTKESARFHVLASIVYLPLLLLVMIVDKSALG